MTKKTVKFKLLSYKQILDLEKKAEELKKNEGTLYTPYIITKLLAYITSIDGNDNKLEIKSILEKLPIRDSLEIQKKIRSVEPGVDDTYEFTNSPSGIPFKGRIKFDIDFFFPKI